MIQEGAQTDALYDRRDNLNEHEKVIDVSAWLKQLVSILPDT